MTFPVDHAVLNAGLDLAMAWGEHWLQPIQGRLATRFPALQPAELDVCNQVCREAMNFGHAQAPIRLREAGGNTKQAFELFRPAVVERYPWVSDENLSRLFSQGCYYAWREGELPPSP